MVRKNRTLKIKAVTITLFGVLLGACGGDNQDPVPEIKKAGVAPLWTDEDVAQIVEVSYLSVPAIYQIQAADVPAECHDVDLLRFKTRTSGDNAADADAALLLVPGVLEGANAFDYIGRQLVYMAKTFRNRDIEVWAMDRRANCFEDLTGMQAAEQAATATQAEDLLLDYYYNQVPINGRTFEGFKNSGDLPMLAEFGVEQSTEDMFAIIKHFIPDPSVSRQKVFVGGHSLGGTHASLFMAWDLDGDPGTLDDAGANLVAGSIGFDTSIGSLGDAFGSLGGTASLVDIKSLEILAQEAAAAEGNQDSDAVYKTLVSWIKTGLLVPRNIQIPLVFSPEAIALPEFVGILAAKAPHQEATAIERLPKTAAVANLFRFFHTRDANNFVWGPFIEDFRYTNAAMVGLMFDDHFSILSFLQTSLGHLNGGAVVEKWPLIDSIRDLPLLGDLIGAIAGNKTQHIAADDNGPLYSWANMDEIGNESDPTYTDTNGDYEYTNLSEEMVRMEDFARALYVGETNLTEWYFPMRILIDIMAATQDFAPDYGINTIYPAAYLNVPTLIVVAKGGLSTQFEYNDPPGRPLQIIELAGQSHLDPMFATVNTPSLHKNEVAENILDFVFENITQ